MERFAGLSKDELELEMARDYHDGEVEPDWRGRGASEVDFNSAYHTENGSDDRKYYTHEELCEANRKSRERKHYHETLIDLDGKKKSKDHQINKFSSDGIDECPKGQSWVNDDRVEGGGYCRDDRKKADVEDADVDEDELGLTEDEKRPEQEYFDPEELPHEKFDEDDSEPEFFDPELEPERPENPHKYQPDPEELYTPEERKEAEKDKKNRFSLEKFLGGDNAVSELLGSAVDEFISAAGLSSSGPKWLSTPANLSNELLQKIGDYEVPEELKDWIKEKTEKAAEEWKKEAAQRKARLIAISRATERANKMEDEANRELEDVFKLDKDIANQIYIAKRKGGDLTKNLDKVLSDYEHWQGSFDPDFEEYTRHPKHQLVNQAKDIVSKLQKVEGYREFIKNPKAPDNITEQILDDPERYLSKEDWDMAPLKAKLNKALSGQ